MLKSVFKYDEESSLAHLANEIKQVADHNSVYFCIGSDKYAFDCLGPKVGTRLKERSNGSVIVYGIEGDTIMARNLQKAYRAIKYVHPSSKIIAIDAAIGQKIGEIQFFHGGIRPGFGAGKNLGIVGDESITCITTHQPMYLYDDHDAIVKFVEKAADIIANAILLATT